MKGKKKTARADQIVGRGDKMAETRRCSKSGGSENIFARLMAPLHPFSRTIGLKQFMEIFISYYLEQIKTTCYAF